MHLSSGSILYYSINKNQYYKERTEGGTGGITSSQNVKRK